MVGDIPKGSMDQPLLGLYPFRFWSHHSCPKNKQSVDNCPGQKVNIVTEDAARLSFSVSDQVCALLFLKTNFKAVLWVRIRIGKNGLLVYDFCEFYLLC